MPRAGRRAVLTIHRLTDGRADYYLADLATELPPAPGRPGPNWVGRAAREFGLEGSLERHAFVTALAGRHPGTGWPLRSGQVTVLGYDLTFSAPKSVSVLLALGGPEVARQVMAGHADAVRGALDYLEAHGVTAVRRDGAERHVIATDGVLAGAFTHGVNRNHDPHLHTHVVMANLVHGEDGRWSACDQRGLWAHRAAGSAVYEAHVRAELTARLGVQWTQAPLHGAEIGGVSPLLLGEFSSRAADIRRHGFEVGVHSARGNHIAWAVTRPAKEPVAFAALAPEWQRRAAAVLSDQPDLAHVMGRRAPAHPTVSEHQFAAVLSWVPDGAARRRDVVTAFADSARLGAPEPTLDKLTALWVPGSGVGVAEEAHSRRQVVPASAVVRALGPRPLDPSQHTVWREAARTIEDYRQRWQVKDRATALGPEQAQPGWSTVRLVDHLRASATLQAARARLGQREPMVPELGRGR
jgi:conjugative relaxase-like TrwC/TraI family protein